jgi:hypothetical protein
MAKILLAAVALMVAWTVSLDAAAAQGSRRWCTQGPIGSFGFPDCAYDTFEQCRWAASGTRRSCTENPYYQPKQKKQRKKKRSN